MNPTGVSTGRYEAVLIVEETGSSWRPLLPAIGAACRSGMAIAVIQAPGGDGPSGVPGKIDVGEGQLVLAARGRRGGLVVDPSGWWIGPPLPDGDSGDDGDDHDGGDGDGDDPMAWVIDELRRAGIASSEVLVVPVAEAGEALAGQLAARARGELPAPGRDPGWVIEGGEFDLDRLRVNAALFTVADGMLGTSGASVASHPEMRRWVLALNNYTGTGPETRLRSGPVAAQLPFVMAPEPGLRRVLDLRSATLWEEVATTAGPVESVRFAVLTQPGTLALRARRPGDQPPGSPLVAPAEEGVVSEGVEHGIAWMGVSGAADGADGDRGGIVAAATDIEHGPTLDRIVVYRSDPEAPPDPSPAVAALRRAAAAGFDALLASHRQAWGRRWHDADIVIEGDDELQRSLRFALFHLMASVPDRGEAAVGARGLTGLGYRGHVFWDADTFVLPFLAATHPASARAMMEYRLRRMPAALAAARRLGRAGARFPWESAWTGTDVTPPSARNRTGQLVPIRTGQLEDHIVAQVAWAASCYDDWTGDADFAAGPGLQLLVQTARFWESRVRRDDEGRAHIYGVIGPDEYHEPVDDNAFTNVMARWNLRRAAAAVQAHGAPDVGSREVERWLHTADALVDGYDPDTAVYEQFAGFHQLEPLLIAEVAPRRPIAADLLLGAERVSQAQVVKQADVLMAHHLVPDELEPGSLEPNLRYYEPRTAHGSSLSPGVHAALLARARHYEPALEALRITSRMDLDDLTGSTAGGLHLATMGSLWQALAYGFAGLRPQRGCLGIDPRLPPAWGGYEIRVRFRDSRLKVTVRHDQLLIEADAPAAVEIDANRYDIGHRALRLARRGRHWRIDP